LIKEKSSGGTFDRNSENASPYGSGTNSGLLYYIGVEYEKKRKLMVRM
jgi:hypothetical protein